MNNTEDKLKLASEIAFNSMIVFEPEFWIMIANIIDNKNVKQISDDLFEYIEKFGEYSIWEVVYAMFIVMTFIVGGAMKYNR